MRKRELLALVVHAAELIALYAWPPTHRSRSQVKWLLWSAGATDHELYEAGTVHDPAPSAPTDPEGE